MSPQANATPIPSVDAKVSREVCYSGIERRGREVRVRGRRSCAWRSTAGHRSSFRPSLLPMPVLTSLYDPQLAAERSYDVAIIGSGILGSTIASSLARSGRSVLLVERDLSEPDRIVGELLQPGGCIAMRKLGIDHCLDGMDSIKVDGYKVFWGGDEVEIPYPEEKTVMGWSKGEVGSDGRKQEGRSFHHGRFIQNLRRMAQATEGVTLVEATVNELLEDEGTKAIIGISATPKKAAGAEESTGPYKYTAGITLITDGCFSKFRRDLLPSHITPIVRSNFVGLMLEDADLPAPHHGHVILRRPDPNAAATPSTEQGVGPVLVYQLATHETRMLIDVPGAKVPSSSTGALQAYLKEHVTPVLPPSIIPSFEAALAKSMTGDASARLRSMPNSYLPAYPQGRTLTGAILAGDSMNMRHPLTGGGMTVAMNDAVILTELLGGGKQVHDIKGDARGVVDLKDWETVTGRLEEWHWRRKKVATCINTLAQALYSLFGADGQCNRLLSARLCLTETGTDENLEVLKTGCFKYFELGGECVGGPVSLLSAYVSPLPLPPSH